VKLLGQQDAYNNEWGLDLQKRRFKTASEQETLPCTFCMEVQQETALPWWHPAHICFSPGHKLPMSGFNWELFYWAR
jgi:hypothetical protein